jgi:hypothetical protein
MRRMLDDQSLSATIAAKDSPVVKLRSESDVPGEGDIVALDAEFVSLAKEEAGESDQALLASAAFEHVACLCSPLLASACLCGV